MVIKELIDDYLFNIIGLIICLIGVFYCAYICNWIAFGWAVMSVVWCISSILGIYISNKWRKQSKDNLELAVNNLDRANKNLALAKSNLQLAEDFERQLSDKNKKISELEQKIEILTK